MREENRCESPMGGWFGLCEKTDKDGIVYATGIGRAVADVTYYNKSQGKENLFTYQMCKDCTKEYRTYLSDAEDETEDNTVVKIEWFDKKREIEYFNRPVLLESAD